MKFNIQLDGIYSSVVETNLNSCDSCCGKAHRTREAGMRCLLRYLNERAKVYRDAARSVRQEIKDRKPQ